MTSDDNLANKVVDQLNKLKEIAATKSHFKTTDMSVIELDGDILFLLINMFKYFQTNMIGFRSMLTMDYNEVKNYVEYLKQSHLLTRLDWVGSHLSLLQIAEYGNGYFKKRIQYGET